MPKQQPVTKSDKNKASKQKKKYKIRNWKEYNESLVNRGSLDFWIEQGARVTVEVEVVDIDGKKRRGRPIKHSTEVVKFVLKPGTVQSQFN